MDFKTYEMEVVKAVKVKIEKLSWYRGVCMDTIKESFDSGLSVERAAEIAEMDTQYWDGNSCFFSRR